MSASDIDRLRSWIDRLADMDENGNGGRMAGEVAAIMDRAYAAIVEGKER